MSCLISNPTSFNCKNNRYYYAVIEYNLKIIFKYFNTNIDVSHIREKLSVIKFKLRVVG